MVQPASADSGEPATDPVATDAYAPYGQLIKMLLPRAGSIAVYDDAAQLLWCSEGYERLDLRELIHGLQAAGTDYLGSRGSVKPTEAGTPAFVHSLRGEHGQSLGSVVVELKSVQGAHPSGSMVASLLRPVLDCLEHRLRLERGVAHQEHEGDNDLDLLLAVDAVEGEQGSALEHLIRHAVEHLGCTVGALLIPERGLSICYASAAPGAPAGTAQLTRTHKHLLAWVQLHNRSMVVNHAGADAHPDAAPYKILSCPIRDPYQRVNGLIALFRAAAACDFEPRDVRLVEFLSRKAVSVLASQHDALTGLANRATFERQVQTLLNQPVPASGRALLHIDMDGLQAINDAFGFQAGDEVIQRLAQVVRAELGPDALLGRIGGDRVAALLADCTEAQACETAHRIRSAMSALGYLDGERSVPVSVSIGVATLGSQSEPAAYALASAELACKQAKACGRDRVEVYRERGAAAIDRTHTLAFASLQEALANNQFCLDGQRVCSLGAGEQTLGFEVLLRMRTPQGNVLGPAKFLAAAEKYQLMPALDRWVVCSSLALLKDAAAAFSQHAQRLMLNVSAQSLADDHFRDFLLEQLAATELPPGLLCFELSESAAANHLAQAEQFVHALTEAGCEVSLDDFGSGLSSFAHLRRLPVQYLKIDGALVRRILADRYAQSMVRAICEAAKALDLRTVAEHVESEALACALREIGADYAQGFCYGRLEPLARLIAPDLPVS